MDNDQPVKQPHPLVELRRHRKPVRNIHGEHPEHLSRLDQITVAITDRVGTMASS